ncbi:putative pectinesterase 53 [Camellia lanceoleosa]|uniref:Pectinesterase 53 n=1 Tax=Camellia lanceoleosa TaxID=1840588 RepID=A0ACC0I001_9ERIC|nr:putative pectinesterase 53 [Camellia lanceoleosa]
MGSFNHSFFQKADNKFEPCLAIKVHKNPNLEILFQEKVNIPVDMAYVTLVGESRQDHYRMGRHSGRIGKDGKPLGTYASATVAVNSPYFIAKKIGFKNKAPSPPSGAEGKQAVALRITADMAAFIHCNFIGAQDTLYDHIGRHYFKCCYIQGSVDFIFGNGLSYYDNCHLHAKTDSIGALTAQKRESPLEKTGFSFVNCKVTGSGVHYLGRAWGTFSRVVFAYTYMDKIITSGGWCNWGDKSREKTVFYGQYKCMGPGADFEGRVSWSRELTLQEAKPFISLNFIDGYDWLPEFCLPLSLSLSLSNTESTLISSFRINKMVSPKLCYIMIKMCSVLCVKCSLV